MQVVSVSQFTSVVKRLTRTEVLSVDTETTGLQPYKDDRLFSVQFADETDEFYFNFNEEYPGQDLLPREWIQLLRQIFLSPGLLIGHNIKFDLHFLAKEGLEFTRELWDTKAMARLEYNEHMKYSLEDCGERIGVPKDGRVKEWLDQNHCYERESIEGKKSTFKRYFFAKVPFDIIVPYGCKDARVTYELAKFQRGRFADIESRLIPGAPSPSGVAENERRLTRVCFKMEREGIRIDRRYCALARDFELSRASAATRTWESLAGRGFVDSAKVLGPVFQAHGIKAGVTEKGNASFTDEVLSPQRDHPLVASLLTYRDSMKRANTYFANYLQLADRQDRIHASCKQDGTATGRFSYADPNLQNLTAEDESEWPVRRAFIPDPDCYLLSIDYAQMEYRLMLDYAQEMSVVEQILQGVDVHEACAKLMGVPRSQAKNINFALLYGAGTGKLARMLGVEIDRAHQLRNKYFRTLPRVQHFIRTVMDTAEKRGYIFNWMGRQCVFPDPRFAYKAGNVLIQGGCADIVKVAMVRLDQHLRNCRTKLNVNVHDECLFNLHQSEVSIVTDLVHIMKTAYTAKVLPMECSVSYSAKSWHDLEEGMPA